MIRRVVRAAAIGLALAAVSLSATLGLLFVRPLPTTDGYYRMLGLHERGEVVRDVWGIPRIYASNDHDLWFLQGYVTAQDRLVQMEEMRVAAARAAVAPTRADKTVMRDTVAMQAYAAGVSKLIAQLDDANALPGELVLAGRRPRPWTAEDVVGVARTFIPRVTSRCVSADASATRSGRPLLAAQLTGVDEPGWYEIGLSVGAERSVGIALPGVPGIVAGTNGWVAWMTAPTGGTAAIAVAALTEEMAARRSQNVTQGMSAPGTSACAADISGTVIGGERVPHGERAIDATSIGDALGWVPAQGARIVVDLADVDTSRSVVSGGASGMRASTHFDDQAPLWERGLLHPLPLSRPPLQRTEGDLVLRAR